MTTTELSATVYSAVINRGDFERYLYDHTVIVWKATPESGSGRTYAIVRTTYRTLVTEQAQANARSNGKHLADNVISEARRLATYQCERLQSGLAFAIVAGTQDEAMIVLGDQLQAGDDLFVSVDER